jgi:hypothetical protein
MKTTILLITSLVFNGFAYAQNGLLGNKSIGVKAGINLANVKGVSSFNNSSKSGFMLGGFLNKGSKGISYRTELIFSRQGYDYKSGANTGTVNLDYLMLPQLINISLGKRIQLQGGAHLAYLLNAKADTSSITGNQTADNIIKFYNRFDYGVGLGLEIYPYKGLLLGLRYNISLNSLYKDSTGSSSFQFIPTINRDALKNNVVQIFAGWRFGK